MHLLDWIVLVTTLATIVAYGAWKSRQVKDAEAWLRGGRDLRWWTIGLSIMATQASAVTFLSTPGQAYEDGMGFVQFYFGVPVAMVILSAVIVPIFYRLKVYTAYEYLEGRFDRKTRLLTALLFLVQRGLGAGLSIYAPAIIVSSMLGWPLAWTNLVIGTLVIAITVSGGTKWSVRRSPGRWPSCSAAWPSPSSSSCARCRPRCRRAAPSASRAPSAR